MRIIRIDILHISLFSTFIEVCAQGVEGDCCLLNFQIQQLHCLVFVQIYGERQLDFLLLDAKFYHSSLLIRAYTL